MLPTPALGRFISRKFFHHPVLVVGAGRSGTTVLIKSLDAHPQLIGSSGEAPLFSHVGTLVYHYTVSPKSDYYQQHSSIRTSDLLKRLRRLVFETEWGPSYGTCGLLARRVKQGQKIFSKRCWIAKAFPDENSAKGLKQLYPKVKFLYIHRNGIDNVQSRTRFHCFRDQSFRKHCETWTDAAKRYQYLINWESSITIRHADLLEHRQLTFNRIYEFLGLEEDNGPASFAQQTLVHPLDKATATDVDVSSTFKSREPSYIQWSADERRIFKEICGNMMQNMGYDIPF